MFGTFLFGAQTFGTMVVANQFSYSPGVGAPVLPSITRSNKGLRRIRRLKMAQDFSPKNPADADVFTFDYAADMAPGDTMLGSTWAVFVETGVDPTPSVMISGSAASIGTTANQLMIGGVSGVYYRFECRANILQASGTMQSLTKSANCLVVSPS